MATAPPVVTVFCLALAASPAQDGALKPIPPEPVVREVGGRLVVSAETVQVVADPGERAHASSLATKTETLLLETPRSLSVIDRKSLDDRQAINITQASDYTLGFSNEDERGAGFNRGFRVGFYDLRRDGLRTNTWSVRETAALDRIQYLRGPAALLYGDGSPGGLVNLILKKPLPVPRYAFSLGAGELGYRRFTADLTGPMSKGHAPRYRMVAAAEGLENGFDNAESRVSILPMMAFDLGREVTLHLDGEYYDQRGRGYRHSVPTPLKAQHGDFSGVPWDLNMASPDDSWRGWNASGGLRLDARLNDRTALHTALRYTRIDGDIDIQALLSLADDDRTARRAAYREKSLWDEYQSDTFVTLSRKTGSVAHNLVAGLEAGLSQVDSRIGIAAAPSLDLFAPVYGPKPPEPPLTPTGNEMLRLGLYVQDQITAGRFRVVPALRWSRLRLEDRIRTGTVARDSRITPSLGLLFLPRPWLSLYGSGSTGFEPPTPGQYLQDGQALAPIESQGLEAGAKLDLLRSRLALTVAAFHITQTQVPEADALGFYRQIAEGRSQGLELEVVGSPARGLVVNGGYSFTSAEITRDVTGLAGSTLPNAPRHKANLWVRHRFQGGALRPLTLGAGIVHVSSRFTARDNAIQVPSFTRVDATASFEVRGPHVVLALGAENLTDTRYVTSGAGRSFFAGPPRRLTATVATAF